MHIFEYLEIKKLYCKINDIANFFSLFILNIIFVSYIYQMKVLLALIFIFVSKYLENRRCSWAILFLFLFRLLVLLSGQDLLKLFFYHIYWFQTCLSLFSSLSWKYLYELCYSYMCQEVFFKVMYAYIYIHVYLSLVRDWKCVYKMGDDKNKWVSYLC